MIAEQNEKLMGSSIKTLLKDGLLIQISYTQKGKRNVNVS